VLAALFCLRFCTVQVEFEDTFRRDARTSLPNAGPLIAWFPSTSDAQALRDLSKRGSMMCNTVLPFCVVAAGGALAMGGIAQDDTTREPVLAAAAVLVAAGIVLALVA
jgi:hypothetical protein